MAHYASVISLKNTIHRLLNSPRISFDSPVRDIIESAYKDLLSLQNVLKRWDDSRNNSERMQSLQRQITEVVCKIEDLLESHDSNDHFLSQSESIERDEAGSSLKLFITRQDTIILVAKVVKKFKKMISDMLWNVNQMMSGDMVNLIGEVLSFTRTIKKMEKEYVEELDNPLPEVEDVDEEDDDVSSNIDFGIKWVGLVDQYWNILDLIEYSSKELIICSITGMAGIGKTVLAKRILFMSSYYEIECRAFVKFGQKYNFREIMRDIVNQVNPSIDKIFLEADDEIIAECLWQSLEGKRFLIVFDDVWDKDYAKLTRMLPNFGSQGRVLITTRLQQIVSTTERNFKMQLLNEKQSWRVFGKRMFGRSECCPPQLEEAGKKIAKRCEGLPLLIHTVANLLSKVEKRPEYWNKVAMDKESSIFMEANDRLSKVLYPSYNYLSRDSKVCFLYMVAFPQTSKVCRSRLINLWIAEGFLEPNPSQSVEYFATECFQELVHSNVVVANKWDYTSYRANSCGLHVVYWHLCRREAGTQKFMHILNSYADGLAESIKGQRRLSIYNNILFGIKDVYSSMASISTARSLLCTGPYHQYEVPICTALWLLRVLDALTIRFYKFPMEVLKLVQLRYLSLTYNGNLPPSISKLRNLEYLIVHEHLSIKSSAAESSYLPVEIWDLRELKFLQIMGKNLPDPCGSILPNLQTLLDVSACSCTSAILEGVPNLKKLRVQIEFAPDFSVQPLSIVDHHLHYLKSFQCVVMNPELGYEFNLPYSPLSVSTCHLKKLTLSGFGFPLEDIHEITNLPSLEVLKLLCYAFEGEKWEAEYMIFRSLRFLLVEESDLVHWTATKGSSFPNLSHLAMKNCYLLEEIPFFSKRIKLELVDCNPFLATYAKDIRRNFNVSSYYSWDE